MPRAAAALMILLLAGSVVLITGRGEPAPDRALAVRAEPVSLAPDEPGRQRVGELLFRRGWVLSSDNPDFGGISAIAPEDEGFVAISDAGGVFRFDIDAEGRVSHASLYALPDGPAPPEGYQVRKQDRDGESLARDPATGRLWIGFEQANAIWRYGPGLLQAQAHATPEAMEDWPTNGGAEAMVRLPDGRFLVFSEEGAGPRGSRAALLFAGDPAAGNSDPVRLGYRPPEGFAVTDAAVLPDGRLLLLNRRFTFVEGVSARLTLAELPELADGAVIEGREIARLESPLTVDNMEAMAVAERDGRTIVWIASDDNFNPLQRTLLLEFELAEEGEERP